MEETHDSANSNTLTFQTVLLGIATTALIHLGASPNPEDGQVSVDFKSARESIDMLELLQMKTQGNLTAEESKLLTSLLNDLRLRYIHATRE